MNAKTAQGLIQEAEKHEQIANKLREAADLFERPSARNHGRKSSRRKKQSTKRVEDMVALLKKDKSSRVSEIIKTLNVSKPTIYAWLKRSDLFVNKNGSVSLVESIGDSSI